MTHKKQHLLFKHKACCPPYKQAPTSIILHSAYSICAQKGFVNLVLHVKQEV